MFPNRTTNYTFDVSNAEYTRKQNLHKIPPAYVFLGILYGIILYGFIYWLDNKHMGGITISEEVNYPNNFISERAQNNLKNLTDIGPKVTGTYENEVLAVEFLKREITHVINHADSSQNIEMDLQVTSGSYYLEFKPYGCVNVYDHVQNVVAKLHSYKETNISILLNCHFDSVPSSPGGSDDGIMCVTMLEILRVMSKSNVRPLHNILFLFNGAEENPLQASHGFITQHKWAHEVRTIINLESAGGGVREVLFQTGPNNPWLLDYYSTVPYPSAQVTAEEIFQSNLIPSDTDFRIFKDFGNATGYDFAFAHNGYVYHTKYDGFHNIPLSAFTHVGDNILQLTRAIANAPELNFKKITEGRSVYFDVFGIFFIHYSHTAGIIINAITSCISVIIIAYAVFKSGSKKKYVKNLLFFSGIVCFSWIISACFILLIGWFLDSFNRTMSWYNKPYLIFGLYIVPNIVITSFFITISNRFKYQSFLSANDQTQLQLHANCLIWSVILIISICFGIRSAYVIMIPILFQSVCFSLVFLLGAEYKGKLWLYAYLIALLVPTMFIFYQSAMLFSVFIPIFGRIGTIINPEFLLGTIACLLFTISSSFYVPLITLIQKPYLVMGTLFTIFILTLAIVFTPLGFPYSGNDHAPTPQRYWIWHTDRTFFNEYNTIRRKDSGYLLLNMDRNSPHTVYNDVKKMEDAMSLEKDCETELLCGVPLYTSRMLAIFKKSTWIPAEVPIITLPTMLHLNSWSNLTNNVRRYNFTATGPSHMSIFISPRKNVTLRQWSFTNNIPEDQIIIDERKNYFILFGSGRELGKLEFWMDLEVPNNWFGPLFDIAVSGKYIDKKYINTDGFSSFLKEFPKWAHVTAWIATYTSWVF